MRWLFGMIIIFPALIEHLRSLLHWLSFLNWTLRNQKPFNFKIQQENLNLSAALAQKKKNL